MGLFSTVCNLLYLYFNSRLKKGVPMKRTKNIRKMKAIAKAISQNEKSVEKISKNESKKLRTKSGKLLYDWLATFSFLWYIYAIPFCPCKKPNVGKTNFQLYVLLYTVAWYEQIGMKSQVVGCFSYIRGHWVPTPSLEDLIFLLPHVILLILFSICGSFFLRFWIA